MKHPCRFSISFYKYGKNHLGIGVCGNTWQGLYAIRFSSRRYGYGTIIFSIVLSRRGHLLSNRWKYKLQIKRGI